MRVDLPAQQQVVGSRLGPPGGQAHTVAALLDLMLGGEAPTRPLRVAIYIRISTNEEHQPFSLEAQEAKLRAYIGIQPGWELVGPVYCDEKSGASLDRPDLQRALAAAKAGRFDILLVYRVDRLSRSLLSTNSTPARLASDRPPNPSTLPPP